VFDPTTKSDKHDVPITRDDAIRLGLISASDYDYLEHTSISLYKKMTHIVESKGFIIADAKFEFGKEHGTDNIYLGDSIGPDEFRLWLKTDYSPGRDQESYDKQILRDWLIKTGFKTQVESSIKGPVETPFLPLEVITELTKRYEWAYEKITGKRLRH
jgi:phosphoribosylaminoimidazole-succinocarboxamide synthase